MKRLPNVKQLKFLFWLAPMFIVAGLTAGIVAGTWDAVPLLLILVGVAIALSWLILESRGGLWRKRSAQAGTNVLISTVAMVVILGVINFLGVRYVQQFDLTENQQFTLAPQSQQVAANLAEPINLVIFSPQPTPDAERLLENYQRTNDRIQYEYIDPQANPIVAQQVGVQTPGEVYLEQGSGDDVRRQYIQTITPQQPLSEQLITNAIARLGNPRTPKVYITQGHGERTLTAGRGGLSEAIGRLEDENYIVEPLQFTEDGQVPTDADVVIVPGPKQDFLDAEIEAIANYTETDGGLLLLLDPTTEPGFTDLLENWGVGLSPQAVILDPDGEAVGLGPAAPLITRYGPHPITEQLNGMSYYPVAQPLSLEEAPGVEATPFLLTGEFAQVQQIDDTGNINVNPEPERQGTLAVGIALSRPAATTGASTEEPTEESIEAPTPETSESSGAEETSSESRLVVIGNSAFATDGLFSQVLNGDVFLNSVAWLSDQEGGGLAIRPREATNRRIVLTLTQQALLGVASILIVPIAAFAVAIALWLKRR
jgi:ABC-type uncharacterized transport system involved in gliding motility auxiliary subunit